MAIVVTVLIDMPFSILFKLLLDKGKVIIIGLSILVVTIITNVIALQVRNQQSQV